MTASVYPAPGEDPGTVAAALLGLAAHARDVVYVPDDGSFTVPEDVADRYIRLTAGPAPAAPATETKTAPPAPARRRHRRASTTQAKKE